MPRYCVSKMPQTNSGDHEVHDLDTNQGCLPDWANRIELGFHASCRGALERAKNYYRDVNGCYWCARPCHTT